MDVRPDPRIRLDQRRLPVLSFAPLETRRLALRPPEAADAAALARLFGARDRRFRDTAAAASWIAGARRALLAGAAFAFLACPRAGGGPAGLAELALAPRRPAGTLRLRAARPGRGGGFMREAARRLAALGRESLGLAQVRGAPPGPLREGGARVVYVAAAVLVDDRRRVLLARRPPGKAMAGLWEFPGGKVEAGERPRGALARELREELGLRIPPSAFAPWDVVHHDYGDFRLLMPSMLLRVPAFAPRPREGQEARWVEAARLGGYPMPAADRPLVRRLARALAQPRLQPSGFQPVMATTEKRHA